MVDLPAALYHQVSQSHNAVVWLADIRSHVYMVDETRPLNWTQWETRHNNLRRDSVSLTPIRPLIVRPES
jgi:hypothetical protein